MSHCKYHPLMAARYYCRHCQTHTCDQCCDEQPAADEGNGRRCFICSRPVTDLGAAFTVEPFWRRLDKIYRYGFSGNAITVIIVCSLLTMASLYNPWLILIPSIVMTRYSFNCLEHTALGKLNAPPLSQSFTGGIRLLLQLIAILILAVGFIGVCGYFLGPEMAALAGLLVLFIAPAVFILLAINGTLNEAINPGNLGQLIAATGAPYIIMLLFVFVMTASVGLLNTLIGDSHQAIQFFAQNLVSNYYTVVIFHLMGYLVFQKQEALGYYAADSEFNREPRSAFEIEQARIEVLVKEGHYQPALDVYRDLLPKHRTQVALWEKCLKLICQVGEPDQVKRFADQALPLLLARDDDFYVANVYRDIVAKAPTYQPMRSQNSIRLGQILFNLGDYRAVAKLLNQFHKRHQDPKEIAIAYDLLASALERIPGLEPKAKNYRTYLSRLTQTGAIESQTPTDTSHTLASFNKR